MESETMSLNFVECYIKIHCFVLQFDGYLPMHDFMTYISCLEIISSLSCAVLPKVDKFSYTVVNISTYLIR